MTGARLWRMTMTDAFIASAHGGSQGTGNMWIWARYCGGLKDLRFKTPDALYFCAARGQQETRLRGESGQAQTRCEEWCAARDEIVVRAIPWPTTYAPKMKWAESEEIP